MRAVTFGLLATLLAACNGAVITREQAITPLLDIHLRVIGSIGEVQAIVRDNPFPQDGDDAAVRGAMATSYIWPPVRLVATRPTNDPYGYRIIAAFGAWPIGGDNYCRNPGLASRPVADRTEAHVVFCLGASVLSEAAGHTRRIDSPDDPRLRELMSNLMLALFNSYQRIDFSE